MVPAADEEALLVIDVQNDYCHSEGALARMGVPIDQIQNNVPQLERFLDQARSRNIPTIFVRSQQNAYTLSKAWQTRSFYQPDKIICRANSWGAEFCRVRPAPTDWVVTKHRYSAFIGTNLDLVLRSGGIKSLVIIGYTTNVCVESTARHAAMNDYLVTVVEDCTAASTTEEHLGALNNIRRYFGRTKTSAEVLNDWDERKGLKHAN